MKLTQAQKTKRLTTSAVLMALAAVLAMVCALIPFLNLPFGGGFTIASMLPIVLISYLFGVRWGLFSAFVYSLLQVLMDLYLGTGGSTVMALFTPGSDDYMGYGIAILILVIDYLVAYTVLGIGGLFRNRFKNPMLSLCLGTALALSLRYVAHILSGYLFYGAWAEWFFTQEGFYAVGGWILNVFHGKWLALAYSVFYNGLYMIPEIIITTVAAAVVSHTPIVRKKGE